MPCFDPTGQSRSWGYFVKEPASFCDTHNQHQHTKAGYKPVLLKEKDPHPGPLPYMGEGGRNLFSFGRTGTKEQLSCPQPQIQNENTPAFAGQGALLGSLKKGLQSEGIACVSSESVIRCDADASSGYHRCPSRVQHQRTLRGEAGQHTACPAGSEQPLP